MKTYWKRELDDLTVMAGIAIAALIGIALGCWLGDVFGFLF